jgi:ketosteroid isomerase-like protein
MDDAMRGELMRLRDESKIRDLVANYADAVARHDAEAWGATWVEDCEWQIMGQPTKGRDAVVALWKTLMAGFEFVIQLPSAGVLEVEGDRGTGRWYVTECGQGPGGAPTLTLGVYHDDYCRVGAEWRFRRRRFHALYMGPADLTAKPIPFPKQA